MDLMGLRPLRVGEMLDLGIKIYRRRFGALVRAVAVVVIPVEVISVVVALSAGFEESDTIDGGDLAPYLAATFVTVILSLLASLLSTAASFEIVSADYVGESRTWQESLQRARSRLGSLLWVSFLLGVVVVLGLVACILPGIYLSIIFSLAVPIVLFEEVRGKAALGRSKRLLAGRFWPTFGVLLISFILTGIVNTGISAALVAVVASSDSEVVATIANGIGNGVASCLTTPFLAAVLAVVYFDARVRREGFDLELLARQIGVDPPPAGAAPLDPEPHDPEQPPFWPPPPGWRPGPPPDA